MYSVVRIVASIVKCSGSTGSPFPLLDSARMLTMTASNIAGAIILIAILLPWFLIPVFVIFIFYGYFATFYRASARELKVRLIIAQHINQLLTIVSVAIGYVLERG